VIIAIDPGAAHVGWAVFEKGLCMRAVEYTPDGAAFLLESILALETVETVVIEEFRLYSWKAQDQAFREMLTSECIGALKWICKKAEVPVVMQPASIQKPTAARLKAAGIKLTSRGQGPHAKSAELHGWYFQRHVLP
jgi:hypothetical protein